jgi:ADP-ribose pyrophosphatase
MASRSRSSRSNHKAPSAPNNPGYSTIILVPAKQDASPTPATPPPSFSIPAVAPTTPAIPKTTNQIVVKKSDPLANKPATGIEVPDFDLISNSSKVTRGKHVRVVTQDYEIDYHNGKSPEQGHREFVQLKKMSATILPMCPVEDKFLLIRQFRYPAWYNAYIGSPKSSKVINESGWLYETIAGVIESGDTPEQTVIREAEEEGNCIIDSNNIRLVHKAMMTPGITNEEMSFYLGLVAKTGVDGPGGLASEGEQIRAKWMTREEIRKLRDDGLIRDCKTIICLYAAGIL